MYSSLWLDVKAILLIWILLSSGCRISLRLQSKSRAQIVYESPFCYSQNIYHDIKYNANSVSYLNFGVLYLHYDNFTIQQLAKERQNEYNIFKHKAT